MNVGRWDHRHHGSSLHSPQKPSALLLLTHFTYLLCWWSHLEKHAGKLTVRKKFYRALALDIFNNLLSTLLKHVCVYQDKGSIANL